MKVDRKRANEIARDRVYRRSVDSEVAEAILIGVREQTDWLMEVVCEQCGYDHSSKKDASTTCQYYKYITRAEHLHRKGEKP